MTLQYTCKVIDVNKFYVLVNRYDEYSPKINV